VGSVFIHSILRADGAIAADGDEVLDLPVNPLSVLLIKIGPLNETGTIGNYSLWAALLGALVNVRVTHRGSAVVDASGVDLFMLALLYHRLGVWQANAVETDNDRRCLVLPVLFGRKAYLGTECFPETKKGELQATMTWDIAATGYDGLRRSVETIELPDAKPEYVQKVTTLAQTFAAVGQNDVDLPIGNVIRAILLWGTTSYAGATPAPTWGQVEVLKDNRQLGYSSSDWEVVRAVAGLRGAPFPPDFRHIHSVNAAGVGREDTLEPEVGLSKDSYYALLDFDPTSDDEYSLDTAGAGRINVRADAEAAEAVRVLPIERVPAAEFTQK
jgi:hypothetical protein